MHSDCSRPLALSDQLPLKNLALADPWLMPGGPQGASDPGWENPHLDRLISSLLLRSNIMFPNNLNIFMRNSKTDF